MKNIRIIALLVSVMAVLANADDAPAPLLTNGSFVDMKNDRPVGWVITPADQVVTVDKEQHPVNGTQSLRIDIKKVAEGQGAVNQSIRKFPPNAKLVLTAKVKGTAARLGYVQVKLKKDGKETKRQKSEWNNADWQDLKVEIATDDADELTVECRFSQSDKAKDQSVWFADVTLVEVKG